MPPNDQQPVTKADLTEALGGLKTELTAVIRDVETKLLGAFFAYEEGVREIVGERRNPIGFQHRVQGPQTTSPPPGRD